MRKIIPHVYLRVSTREQYNHGGGWAEQDRLTDEYIKNRSDVFDLDNIQYIHDEGVSAYSGSNVTNGNLGRFIAAVEKGEIGEGHALVCYSIDRLSRQNTWIGAKLVSTLIDADVEIHNVLEGTVLKKEFQLGAILSSIYLMRANNESEIKKERAIAGYKKRLTKSIETGTVLTGQMPRWLYNNNGKYAIDEKMQGIINFVFDEYVNGVSTGYIAKKLNEKGWLYKDTEWRGVFIARLIRDRRLLGEHIRYSRPKKGEKKEIIEVIPNFYPVAIESDRFQTANNMLDVSGSNIRGRTRISYGDSTQLKNLFSGILVCGFCGGKISVSKNSRKGDLYLRCRTRYEKKECKQKDIKYQTIEGAILKHVKGLDISKLVNKVDNSRLELLKSELTMLKVDESEIQTLINERESKKLRIRPATLRALEEAQDRIDDLDNEIKSLNIDNFEPSFEYDIDSVMNNYNVEERGSVKKGLKAIIEKMTYKRYDNYILVNLEYYKDYIKHVLIIDNESKEIVTDVSIRNTTGTIYYESKSVLITFDQKTQLCTLNSDFLINDYVMLLNVIDMIPQTKVVKDYMRSNINKVLQKTV
ncbi:recombinase zinc beta ribbon domain-containing protein [Pectobacterium brasiliense]|uniref:recombinase family protein n=1 Tax=Pectobacterium brasiliense TaxID=180957 RepID=UPI0030195D31